MPLVPLSTQPAFFDGALVEGAQLFAFDTGTTTPRTLFLSRALDPTRIHATPVVAADGTFPVMWAGVGDYDVRVTDASGAQIHFFAGLAGDVAASGGSGFDPLRQVPTGAVIRFYGTGRIAGYVRANGGTIGPSSADASERSNDDCHDLYVALYAADTTLVVAGGRSPNGAEADWTAAKTLTLPNYINRFQVCTGSVYAVGQLGGEDTHVLSLNEMPAHNHEAHAASQPAGGFTPAGSIDAVPDHQHVIAYQRAPAAYQGASAGIGAVMFLGDENSPNLSTQTRTSGGHIPIFHGNAVDPHSHVVTVSTDNAGSGAAHNNLPPYIGDTVYLKL